MSEATQTQEVEVSPVESNPTPVTSEVSKPSVSPAQDLREIQHLLLGGIFPGNVAPAVVKAYSLLEKMCLEIESATK